MVNYISPLSFIALIWDRVNSWIKLLPGNIMFCWEKNHIKE